MTSRPSRAKPVISCGVIVTDGEHVLLGHATGSPRWDIPKGLQNPGETPLATALRELEEETGLAASAETLHPLGEHAYLPGKSLVLFVWTTATMPLPDQLVCRSTFPLHGRCVPEFDRFACPPWVDAWPMLGKSMRLLLTRLTADPIWPSRR